MRTIISLIRPAIVCFAVLTLLTGVLYPAFVTGVAQAAYPHQANGSIMKATLADGTVREIGSSLLAQPFTEPKYLIGRPAGPATNLSSVGDKQEEAVQQRIARWHELDPANKQDIPLDLVTVSGSGVDPHITPAAADYQVSRIARERGIGEDEVRRIIKQHTSERFLGFWGEPAVNVLQVNAALDGLSR
ncbi:potassium-transporting ATPase subunit C [Gorillibacterium timonense]|uniref:potassium-transporting ATPase subunit C n=1 Tax=Gorillibacterium timonense TaxID=1689269 RepID=UPI00071E3B0C|nr:potassium-transporting ATPase subunit C [Gorillibacterium timonense]